MAPGAVHGRPSLPRDFETVLAGARANDPLAWTELYEWLSPGVAGYLRMVGAREVEDLTSEVLLAVFRRIDGFSGTEANFRSWVFTVAHSRMVDERRRHHRRPDAESLESAEEAMTAQANPEQATLDALDVARIETICARLPPDQRAVILLRIIADLSIEQVASIVGKSPGAVKQLQRRGLERARRLYLQEGVTL